MLVLILVFALILIPTNASAEECDGATCIDVSANENKEVVITVKKGSPGSSTTKKVYPRKSSAKTTAKKTWIPWLPKPASTYRPKPRASAKPKVKTETISAASVMEQVRSLLPQGAIIAQPAQGALVRELMYLRTTVPPKFATVIVVLDLPIQINLTAQYLWDFGDGGTLITSDPGAPYPLSTITHRYESANTYQISLTVRWQGTWRSGPLTAPIRGEVTQRFTLPVKVSHANFRITR